MKVIRLFAKSFQFLGEARGRYLLGVALGACELALLFATPTINQMLIDIVTGERQGNVVYTLLGMLAVFCCWCRLWWRGAICRLLPPPKAAPTCAKSYSGTSWPCPWRSKASSRPGISSPA